jgi:hypothetical protein
MIWGGYQVQNTLKKPFKTSDYEGLNLSKLILNLF